MQCFSGYYLYSRGYEESTYHMPSYLVGSLQGRRVEKGLRPTNVRVGHAPRHGTREGQTMPQALLELVGGLVVHAVDHVQVAQSEVNLVFWGVRHVCM